GGQDLLPGGCVFVAASGGGLCLCVGPDGCQARFAAAEADLAEFVTNPLWRPRGVDGIGVAQVQQRAICQVADVRAVDWAEGGAVGGARILGGRGGGVGGRRGGGGGGGRQISGRGRTAWPRRCHSSRSSG